VTRPPVLVLDRVARTFRQGDRRLTILTGASLTLAAGETVALVAPSGAGKSTLLHIAGLLEKPDGGSVHIAGTATERLPDRRRTRLRRERIGFVYQYHHLLAEFTALENVILPQLIARTPHAEARRRARDLLGRVGLGARETHRPGRLSGGERQRVAIARALANGPSILFADEPTGNLDPLTAEAVFAELARLVQGEGLAALVATHNIDLARRMDRVVTLLDGKIVAHRVS